MQHFGIHSTAVQVCQIWVILQGTYLNLFTIKFFPLHTLHYSLTNLLTYVNFSLCKTKLILDHLLQFRRLVHQILLLFFRYFNFTTPFLWNTLPTDMRIRSSDNSSSVSLHSVFHKRLKTYLFHQSFLGTWNSLPSSLRNQELSYECFRRGLTPYLFVHWTEALCD